LQNMVLFLREKFPLLLMIIVLLSFLLLSLNRFVSLKTMRERLQLEEQALAKEQEQLLLLRQLEKEGPRFLQRLELLDNLIPEKTTEYQLVRELQKIASISGIHLLQVQFDSELSSDAYMEIPMDLSLEGSFRALLQMLRTLKEGERAFRVDKIEITGEESGIRANLRVSAFYRDKEESAS